jgi:hypothetical protein
MKRLYRRTMFAFIPFEICEGKRIRFQVSSERITPELHASENTTSPNNGLSYTCLLGGVGWVRVDAALASTAVVR